MGEARRGVKGKWAKIQVSQLIANYRSIKKFQNRFREW